MTPRRALLKRTIVVAVPILFLLAGFYSAAIGGKSPARWMTALLLASAAANALPLLVNKRASGDRKIVAARWTSVIALLCFASANVIFSRMWVTLLLSVSGVFMLAAIVLWASELVDQSHRRTRSV